MVQLASVHGIVFDRIPRPNHLGLLQARNRRNHSSLNINRHARRHTIHIDLVRIQSFRLQEDLVRHLIRKLDELVLYGRTVPRPDPFYLAAVERGTPNAFPYDAGSFRSGPAQEALNLGAIDPVCQKGKRSRFRISRLWLELRPIDGTRIKPRRGTGLQSRPTQIQTTDLVGKHDRWRLAVSPTFELSFPDMGEPIQKCPGSDDDRPTVDAPPIHKLHASHSTILDPKRRHLSLFDPKIWLPLQNFLHANSVLLLVALGPRRPNRWPPARIEKTELDADCIRYFAHHTAERVNLPNEVALRDSTDRRIARHLCNQIRIHGDHDCAHSHAGTRARCLAPGVTAAHNHNVERLIHWLRYYCSRANTRESTCYRRRRSRTRVSLEITKLSFCVRIAHLAWKSRRGDRRNLRNRVRLCPISGNSGIDLTVVGPETPLVAGVVDKFRSHGFPIVGPTAENAALEGSKVHSKRFMERIGVPTARFATVSNETEARSAVKQFRLPVVLKTDGLAAGKGVIIAQTDEEAEAALTALAYPMVIEEFLEGEEVSFIVLCDGKRGVALEPSQDHKRIFDGDQGPNTGGMGAYSDSRILSTVMREQMMDTIIEPVVRATAFTGFLYAGLMMTADGPSVLEFNVRMGDPETQALMMRLESDWGEALMAAARGALTSDALQWSPEPATCVVMAAAGYPGNPQTGQKISGLDDVRDAVVFHAGTKRAGDDIVTAGGRVLGVTARGADLKDSIDRAYAAVARISFDGMQYRRDIGVKGLRR